MSRTITTTEALLYALIVAGPLLFGCVEPWSQSLLELGCFALAALCLLRPERGRPSALPLAAIGAVLAVGAAQWLRPIGPLDPRPRGPFTVSAHETLQALLLWSAYAALAWSVPRVARDPPACRRFVGAVAASGAVVAAIGLLQLATGATELYGLRYVREDATPFGPYYNRDHAAALMAVSWAAAAGTFVSRLRSVDASWRGLPPDWVRSQAISAATLALLTAGLAASPSRGALLGLGAGAAGVFLLATRFVSSGPARRAVQAGLIVAGAAALTGGYLAFAREVGVRETIESSTAGRLSLYASGLRMLRDSPVFGWGLGAVGAAFGAYQEGEVAGPAPYVHNDWLQLALQCGLVGAAAAASALAFFGLRLVRLWWSARSREMRALIGGGLAGLAAFGTHCLVDFCSQIPANAAVAAALLGWLSGCAQWADKRPLPPARPARGRRALVPVLAALAALALRPAIGAWYARRASFAPAGERAPIFARAASWDPRSRYFFQMGVSWLDAGRLDAALAGSSAALRLEPLNPDYLALHADLLERLGRKEESRLYAEKAQRQRFDPALPEDAPSADDRAAGDLEALRRLGLLPKGRG